MRNALDWLQRNAQEIGGWIIFADMILGAVLLAFWEKAGKIRVMRHRKS